MAHRSSLPDGRYFVFHDRLPALLSIIKLTLATFSIEVTAFSKASWGAVRRQQC